MRTGRSRKFVPYRPGDAVECKSQKPEPPIKHGDPEKTKLIGRKVRLKHSIRAMTCTMPIDSVLTITAQYKGRFVLKGRTPDEMLTGIAMSEFEVLD